MARIPAFSEKTFWARSWTLLLKSIGRFSEIDGDQRAAAFAYYAFFSLFPLIVLLVVVTSLFLFKDQQEVTKGVIEKLNDYLPLSDNDKGMVVKTIEGLIQSRGKASAFALITLVWSSLRFFQSLVQGVNSAWGNKDYSWWHLPLKNLGMICLLGSALVLGIFVPELLKVGFSLLKHTNGLLSDVPFFKYITDKLIDSPQGLIAQTPRIAGFFILFYTFTLFYKYAPAKIVEIRDVWGSALLVTISLQLLVILFHEYLVRFGNFNAVYGAFAGVIALLFWIYLNGSLIIFSGCISAVRRELLNGGENRNGNKKK